MVKKFFATKIHRESLSHINAHTGNIPHDLVFSCEFSCKCWGKTYSAQQFPMFDDVPQFVHIKLMSLASMVKHHQFIVECFNANHIVLANWQLF